MKPAVVVTGAGSGIGREIARRASRDGSFMLLVGVLPEPLADLAAELTAAGLQAHPFTLNLLDPDAGERIEAVLSERGLYCDLGVNSAGLGLYGPATEIDRGAQMKLFDVHARALTELTLRFLPGMMRRGRGGVLNDGSIAGCPRAQNGRISHDESLCEIVFNRACRQGRGIQRDRHLPEPRHREDALA